MCRQVCACWKEPCGGCLLLSAVGLRACGCGICVGLRVCGNDGLCGLVKQRRWGACSQPPSGTVRVWAQAQPGQREAAADPELCVGCASLLPPGPYLPPELQTHPTNQNVSSSPATQPERGLEAQQSPWWEMRPCAMRQGLSMAKQVGESIRRPNFKAQIHRSGRADSSSYLSVSSSGNRGSRGPVLLCCGKHKGANKYDLLLG